MSDQSTERVEFEIGFGQDPKAANALEALARKVAEAQAKMLEGVKAIEQSAAAAEAAVGRVGAAAGKVQGSASGGAFPGSYQASFPATTPATSVPTAAPPQTRLPVPYMTPPLTSPASGRGPTSLPVPYATVPSSPPKPPAPPPTAPQTTPPAAGTPPVETPKETVDLPGHLDRLAKSSEKAFKGVVEVVRGFTLLGLVSEESSEKLLKGLVATEGVVSILKGGAEIVDAAANIAALRAAMRGGAAGAGGAAAAGAGGAAAAGGGGFFATTFMGVNVGTGGAAAIALTALASLGLVAAELRDTFNGTADQAGSLTYTIAEWEVGLVSGLGELTGWFDYVGNAARKEAESKAALFSVQVRQKDEIEKATLEFGRKVDFARTESENSYARMGVGGGRTQDEIKVETEILEKSYRMFEESQSRILAMQREGLDETNNYLDAVERVAKVTTEIESTTDNLLRLQRSYAKEQVDAAKKVADSAKQELDARKKSIEALDDRRATAAERFAALDDLEKGSAVRAIQTARTKGASGLSDADRELLRRVGGSEAEKFAREADLLEARRFGFDTSFGSAFDSERQKLQAESARFEATIKEQNNIVIQVESREKEIVKAIVESYLPVIEASNRRVEAAAKRELDRQRSIATQKAQADALQTKAFNR